MQVDRNQQKDSDGGAAVEQAEELNNNDDDNDDFFDPKYDNIMDISISCSFEWITI